MLTSGRRIWNNLPRIRRDSVGVRGLLLRRLDGVKQVICGGWAIIGRIVQEKVDAKVIARFIVVPAFVMEATLRMNAYVI